MHALCTVQRAVPVQTDRDKLASARGAAHGVAGTQLKRPRAVVRRRGPAHCSRAPFARACSLPKLQNRPARRERRNRASIQSAHGASRQRHHVCFGKHAWKFLAQRRKEQTNKQKIEFDTVLHLLVDSVNKAKEVRVLSLCTASAGFESMTFMSISSVPIYYMLSPSPWSNQLFQLNARSRRGLSHSHHFLVNYKSA